MAFFLCRILCGIILQLTREKAGELLGSIAPERIEKIESEKCLPHPGEVLIMAARYKLPNPCSYCCANQCPIGQQYVPEIKIKDLSQIVLEMLASLNSMNKKKERLIEITADGKIDHEELEDFVYFQEKLERISITVEALQLWAEKMLATGVIDMEEYKAHKVTYKEESTRRTAYGWEKKTASPRSMKSMHTSYRPSAAMMLSYNIFGTCK